MHNDDKIWREAIGDLVRTRNKVAIDAFIEGVALIKKVRDGAKWFSWDQRTQLLDSSCKSAGVPTITPDMDLNKTRVAAIHSLFLSMLRPKRGMALAWLSPLGQTAPTKMTDSDYEEVAEFEALGNVTKHSTKLM